MKRIAALLLLAVPTLAQNVTDPAKVGVDVTVNAIEKLENQRDPKCDATATRLENFMYGTPLSVGAREKKVDLQKRLILAVWTEASDEARVKKLAEIPVDVVTPIIQRHVSYSFDDQKNAHVKLSDGSELVLDERDARQYATVAYALRAILATQQDALLSPDVKLVPFSADAVQSVKQMVDVYTLAALNLSDKSSRKANEKQLTAANLESQWKRLAPLSAQKIETLKPLATAEAKPGEVLHKIVDQKLVSFATYNSNADPLLASNIQSFYARIPWAGDAEQVKAISRNLARVDMDFIATTLDLAQKKAIADGSPVVREKHIRAVYAEMAPYDVNIYEDVIFFSRLPKEKQVYIEAYDADSLRDSGLHWRFIKQVIDNPSFPLKLDVDPFAAELLSEGDAQIAVLTFRMAGQIAKEQKSPTLLPEHILLAQQRMAERFTEQLKAPAPAKAPTRVASSSAVTKSAGKFFDDATERTGIDFMHRSSDWLSRFQRTFLYSLKGTDAVKPGQGQAAEDFPPTFSGSGIAAEDINNDGWADVLIVGGRGNRLYLNNRDGTFRDATAKSGLNWIGRDGKPGEPRQPLIIDLDNDGQKDVVISYVNAPHRVYRNNGDGTFTDVTASAGLGGDGLVGGPIVALDFDRDGLLDLYVGYYGNYVQGVGPNLARVNTNGTPNKLFRNTGNFTFKEVPNSGTESTGWTQAAVSVDFDRDGWPDLVVGNDFGINAYYRNKGDGTFEDVASRLGTDLPSSSMNVGTADLNKDGFPEFYISNIVAMVKDEKYVMPTEETKMKRKAEKLATMRVVQNNQLFISSAQPGLPKYAITDAILDPMDTSTGWAWDADFFDFDNDGDDDLYVLNGLHEYFIYSSQFKVQTAQGEKEMQFAVHEKEPNVFYVNENGRLQNRSAQSGADFSGNSRSAAYLDFDNDGDLDVVINNFDSKAVFLVNNAERLHNNWIKIRLAGDPSKGSNRDAIGATIVATTPGGNRIWRTVQSATGYLSQHPAQQHLGLGKETSADVVVVWPNGEKHEYKGLVANQLHVIKQ
jgi:hypothetical protein